jgi:hypothetical protein
MKGIREIFGFNNSTGESIKPKKEIKKPILIKNEIAEINHKKTELNKFGSIDTIINEWVPDMIDEFIAKNNLNEQKIGLLKSEMGGKSQVIREINTGDNNNKSKTKDSIKETVYEVLDTYCRKEKIYRDKAA